MFMGYALKWKNLWNQSFDTDLSKNSYTVPIGRTNRYAPFFMLSATCNNVFPQKNDVISWLMDGARAAKEPITLSDISSRILLVSFGAIHTSSAVSYLCADRDCYDIDLFLFLWKDVYCRAFPIVSEP